MARFEVVELKQLAASHRRCGTKELKCCATCNVVNHEFITSRYLSVRVRSYSGQTSMALFSCSLGR